jgi:hypothetical protein
MTKKNENKGLVPSGKVFIEGKGYEVKWETPAAIFESWEKEAQELREILLETEGNLKLSDVEKTKSFARRVRNVARFIYEPEYDFQEIILNFPDDDYGRSKRETYNRVMDQLHRLALNVENFNAIFADVSDVQNAYVLVDLVDDLANLNCADFLKQKL